MGSVSHATERKSRAEQSRAEHSMAWQRLWKRDDAIAGSRPSSDVSKRGLELETSIAGSVVVTVSVEPARLPVSGQAREPGTLGLGMSNTRFRMFYRPFYSETHMGRAVLRFAKDP
jgi:hypothetical protein